MNLAIRSLSDPETRRGLASALGLLEGEAERGVLADSGLDLISSVIE